MYRYYWTKRLVIGAALLLVLGWLGSLLLNIQSADGYLRAYLRYRELISHMEQAELTVTDSYLTVGEYSLNELGLLKPMRAAARECFGFSPDKEPAPKDFARLSRQERKAASKSVTDGAVAVDAETLDVSPVLRDLQNLNRGEGDLIPEAMGAVADEVALKAVLRQAMTDWVASDSGMESRSVDLDNEKIYAMTGSKERLSYDEVVQQAMQNLVIDVKLMDRTAQLEVGSVVRVDVNGIGTINKPVLENVIKAWALEGPGGWSPYRLESHGRGTLLLDFLHVNYNLDQEKLMQVLTEQIMALDNSPVEAEYLCSREGKPYSIGEAYIEVDIAQQKMRYYEKGEMLIETDVVTGYPNGRWTWPGIYRIQEKDTNRQLSGEDYSVHVDYWLGYDGDYGIHDAQWRDEFGGELYMEEGSHGCTNTPLEAMAAIHEKAELGMTVIVHYIEE